MSSNKTLIIIVILIVSAVFSGLSRQGQYLSLISFFSFIPFIYMSINSQGKYRLFFLGILFGLVYNAFLIYWIINTMINYGNLSLPEAILILIVLCLYLGSYWGFFSLIINWTNRKKLCLFILPSVWIVFEYIISWLFTGFPWTLIGYNLSRNILFIQLSDIGSVYILSYLILTINMILYTIIFKKNYKSGILSLICIFAMIIFYGYYRINYFSSGDIRDNKDIIMIQPNIYQEDKMDRNQRAMIMENMFNYLRNHEDDKDTDLIVFPETAFNIRIKNSIYFDLLKNWVHRNKIPVLTGTIDYEIIDDELAVYNSALFLDENHSEFYNKINLVPFGEYLPFSNLPIIRELRNIIPADLSRGRKRIIFRTKDGFSFISPICFEIIFPYEITDWLKADTDAIITLTNDAWFGRTKASFQHFDKVVLRAVENRKPSLMAANTGVSGFVDIIGNRYDKTQLFNEEIIKSKLTLYENERTIWTYIYRINLLIYILLSFILEIIFRFLRGKCYAVS